MKKTLAMLLAALMLLLPACGQGTSSDAPSSPLEQTVAPVQTEGPAPEETPTQTAGPTQSSGGSGQAFDPSATIEETVLVDESDVKITTTGLKYTASSVKLSLSIENNSDKNLSFHAGTLGYNCNSVNGYMVDDGYLNASVASGKKTNETVTFDVGELTLLGFTDIADVELGFDISDDQYDDYLETGPCQLKTSIADSYDYASDTYRAAIANGGAMSALGGTIDHDSDETVFDQKGVRVLSQTLVTNSSGDQALLVEVENTGSDMVYVSVGDVSLNGLGIQSGTWSTDWISAGKRRVISMDLSSMLDKSYQKAFGINEVGTVAYSLEIKDIDRDTLISPQQLAFSTPNSGSYDATGAELYQEGGIRVVSKGLAPDSFELSDDIHLLLLVENTASEGLGFDVDYSSVSVNGYMTSFICYSRWVDAGGSSVLDVELMGHSLEENGITELSDITEVELTLEVKNDSYKTVAEPVVTVTIGQ